MTRCTLLLFVVVLLSGADRVTAQQTVEARGITSTLKLEEVISGHLTEINAKFKLRVTEVTFAPQGYLGEHHHVGPGIRYVLSGDLTFSQAGQDTIYHAGEYFFESGNIAHGAQNKTNLPLRVMFVEILPVGWPASAVIPPSHSPPVK